MQSSCFIIFLVHITRFSHKQCSKSLCHSIHCTAWLRMGVPSKIIVIPNIFRAVNNPRTRASTSRGHPNIKSHHDITMENSNSSIHKTTEINHNEFQVFQEIPDFSKIFLVILWMGAHSESPVESLSQDF